MKLYLSYGTEEKEGFERCHPEEIYKFSDDSVEELHGEYVLEKVPDLVTFLEGIWRVLVVEGKANFSAPHYANVAAWRSPLTVRALSEQSLNFACLDWRKASNYTEVEVRANFEVMGNFALEQDVMNRSDEARAFWMKRYMNIAQVILFTLIKKVLPEA